MSKNNSDSEESNSESYDSFNKNPDFKKEEKIFMNLYPIVEKDNSSKNNNNNETQIIRSREKKRTRRISTNSDSLKNELLDKDGTYKMNDIFLISIIKERCPLNKKIVFLTISKFIKHSSLMEKIVNECQIDNNETPENLANTLAQNMSFIEYKKNRCIFKLGDYDDNFYFIISGKVKIYKIKTINVKMSFKEYLSYCLLLNKNKEDFLLNQILSHYEKIIPIKIVEEIKKTFNIVFKIKLFEKIREEIITNNKELKLYFDNNGMKYDDIDIDKIELEQLLPKINRASNFPNVNQFNQNNVDWKNYILKKCTLSNEEKSYFEKFDNIFKSNEKLDIECYIYEFGGYLQNGNYFGDMPIEKDGIFKKKKREYSIFAEEDTIFGILKNEEFIYIIAPKIKNERMQILKFINSNYFFKPINGYLFTKNYFHYFIRREFNRETVLFDINTFPQSLFLLQEGNISLTIQCSLIQLNGVLQKLYLIFINNKNYSEFLNKKLVSKKIVNTIKEYGNDFSLKKMKLHSEKFVQEMKKIRTFQISLVSKDEIIGLEEIFFKIPYCMKGVVTSEKCICYELPIDGLEIILKMEGNVEDLYYKTSVNKLLSLIERIQTLKKNLIDMYKNKYENDKNKTNVVILTETNITGKNDINKYNLNNKENIKNKDNNNNKLERINLKTENNIEIIGDDLNDIDLDENLPDNPFYKRIIYKSPKRGLSSIKNKKIRELLSSKRNEEKENINNSSSNNNSTNLSKIKILPNVKSAKKLTIRNKKYLYNEPIEQKQRAGSVNSIGLNIHNSNKANKDIDAFFIKDKYYTLDNIKKNIERNKNKINLINKLYKNNSLKYKTINVKEDNTNLANDISEYLNLKNETNLKTINPISENKVNIIYQKRNNNYTNFKSFNQNKIINTNKNLDNYLFKNNIIFKSTGIQSNNIEYVNNNLKISNNYLFPKSPYSSYKLPKLNIRYDEKKLNTINLNPIKNSPSSDVIIDQIIEKTKKAIVPKLVKDFYKDKKIKGFIPFIPNKENNTLFLRKYHKKYNKKFNKNTINSEKNESSLPKILKCFPGNKTLNNK